MNLRPSIAALLLGLLPVGYQPLAHAQRLSLGAVGGTNLTDDFRTLRYSFTYQDKTYADVTASDFRSFAAGPSLELGLPHHLSLLAGALRRTLRFESRSDFPAFWPFRGSVTTWQFPVLLKYGFTFGKVQPFVAAGPSFRRYSNPSGSRPSPYGATAGVGFELNAAGRVAIAPSLRYTRWAAESAPFRPTIRNQLELLVGIHYRTDTAERNLFGEKIWFGIIAGAPMTNDFHPISPDFPKYTGASTRIADFRFAAGLMAEFPISGNLSLEVNGLYRRLHFQDGPEVVITWQMPVLAKCALSRGRTAPFVEAGPSFRLAGNLNWTNPSRIGITGGVGVETRAQRVRFTPTLRYTRWAADGRGASFYPTLTKSDQVELLVGVSF